MVRVNDYPSKPAFTISLRVIVKWTFARNCLEYDRIMQKIKKINILLYIYLTVMSFAEEKVCKIS